MICSAEAHGRSPASGWLGRASQVKQTFPHSSSLPLDVPAADRSREVTYASEGDGIHEGGQAFSFAATWTIVSFGHPTGSSSSSNSNSNSSPTFSSSRAHALPPSHTAGGHLRRSGPEMWRCTAQRLLPVLCLRAPASQSGYTDRSVSNSASACIITLKAHLAALQTLTIHSSLAQGHRWYAIWPREQQRNAVPCPPELTGAYFSPLQRAAPRTRGCLQVPAEAVLF